MGLGQRRALLFAVRGRYDAVVDFVHPPDVEAMEPFGRLALLGCTRDSNFTVNYYRKVHARGITMIGTHTNARPDLESHGGWWTTRDDALRRVSRRAI